jgi:hypothetical protein
LQRDCVLPRCQCTKRLVDPSTSPYSHDRRGVLRRRSKSTTVHRDHRVEQSVVLRRVRRIAVEVRVAGAVHRAPDVLRDGRAARETFKSALRVPPSVASRSARATADGITVIADTLTTTFKERAAFPSSGPPAPLVHRRFERPIAAGRRPGMDLITHKLRRLTRERSVRYSPRPLPSGAFV